MRSWFRDLRVSRKLLVVIIVHLLHATVLLVVTAYGMKALSASRAYVEGEGLWSKAEKEGTIHLIAYASGGDEAEYQAFLNEMKVISGDRRARLEMDKAHPDMDVVREGFIQGRLAPGDVGNLYWLYHNFASEPHLAKAIAIWAAADQDIFRLLDAGALLHAAVQYGDDPGQVENLTADVYAIDAKLTIQENLFSHDLGNGVRWLTGVVTVGAIGLTVVFVGAALLVSSAAARQITRSLRKLNDTAQGVSAGDLSKRVALDGRDEVAAVGRTFDAMADRLAALHEETEGRNAALRESLQRFRVLAEGSPLGIFHTDASGRLDYANRRWEEIAGVDPRDHDAIRKGVHPEDLAGLRAAWRTSLAAGTPVEADFRYVHADGHEVYCSTRASPVRDEAGQITGFVGILEDATERKQVEQARQREAHQASEIVRLEELNAFRVQFINTAAHELRTPLTPIQAQLYLLRKLRAPTYTGDEKHSLDVLDRNLARLSTLVEDMLQVARYQAGRLGIEAAPGDLHALVREVAESFVEATRTRSITLDVRTEGDGSASFDGKRMAQVFYNLLGNALKFTPAGGRIELRSRRLPDALEVRVSDTGMGIKPEDLKRLFQPFSQVHNEGQKVPVGTGLGLYICRAIVELHGGTIAAASEGLGTGFAVTVRLPLRPAVPDPSGGVAANGAARPSAPATPPYDILGAGPG